MGKAARARALHDLHRSAVLLQIEGRYADQEVLVRGWYRRGPAPVIELRDITAADGTTSKSHQWVAAYVFSALLTVGGILAVVLTSAK